jgi:hypothetical protein
VAARHLCSGTAEKFFVESKLVVTASGPGQLNWPTRVHSVRRGPLALLRAGGKCDPARRYRAWPEKCQAAMSIPLLKKGSGLTLFQQSPIEMALSPSRFGSARRCLLCSAWLRTVDGAGSAATRHSSPPPWRAAPSAQRLAVTPFALGNAVRRHAGAHTGSSPSVSSLRRELWYGSNSARLSGQQNRWARGPD